MPAQSDTAQFIDQLQTFARGRLNFPRNLEQIVDQVREQRMEELFQDLIFHAKFAVKTKDVLTRIGQGGEGYDKLSVEFQNSVEKTSTLLKTLVKESPEAIKQQFVGVFFGLDPQSFERFLKLLEDLSWVKNWVVDGHALPLAQSREGGLGRAQSQDIRRQPTPALSTEHTSLIRKSAVLGIVLMIFFFLIDPPVTIFGWGLAIVVVLLFLAIAMTSHTVFRKSQPPI